MNKLLRKIPKNSHIFILYISIFLLFFGLIKYLSGDNYKNRTIINSALSNINSINNNLFSSVENNTINTKKAFSLITDSTLQLNNLKNDLLNIEDSSLKNSIIKENLITSIENTILLYNYLLNSLSSPKDIINNESIDTFYNLVKDCTLSYEKLSSYSNKKIYFSKETILFLDNYSNYLNNLIKNNRDNEFISKQNREFIIKLESLISSMEALNKDFSLAINKVREDNRDLSVIINDIYLKEVSFEGLKDSIFSLSIPDGYIDTYNYLFDYINYYEIYIATIKNALIYEKTCSDTEKYIKEINKNYKNAYSKRDDVLASYNDFILAIKNN